MSKPSDLKVDHPLQAVIFADSFNTSLRPVTSEKPKMLCPLANIPMLEYTLESLASTGVYECILICCTQTYFEQFQEFLKISRWKKTSGMSIRAIFAPNCYSQGDALRYINGIQMIRSDPFILISGDIVFNLKLDFVLAEHRERRKGPVSSLFTLILKRASHQHRTRSLWLESDLVITHCAHTNRLLEYDISGKRSAHVNKELLSNYPDICIRYDLMDTQIVICSLEMISLFATHFDFNDVRHDLVRGVLSGEIMGDQVHIHVISNAYAARIGSWRTYDAVSRDIIQRWTHPLVPDNNFTDQTTFHCSRKHIYKEENVHASRSSDIGACTLIGSGTRIGENSIISKSIIGRNCIIGDNVSLIECYLWNDVVVENGVSVKQALLCNGVIVRKNATIEPGVILSFNVIVGEGMTLNRHLMITTFPWSSEERPLLSDEETSLLLGTGGKGRIYVPSLVDYNSDDSDIESDEDQSDTTSSRKRQVVEKHRWQRFLIANSLGADTENLEADDEEISSSIHEEQDEYLDNLEEDFMEFDEEDDEEDIIDETTTHPSWEVGHAGMPSIMADMSSIIRETAFFSEMNATIVRGEKNDFPVENIGLEASALKLSHDASLEDYSIAVLAALFEMLEIDDSIPMSRPSNTNLTLLTHLLKKWNSLLSKYATNSNEEQVRIIRGLARTVLMKPNWEPLFRYALQLLYESDVVQEDAVFSWAKNPETAFDAALSVPIDTSWHNRLMAAANPFLEWLEEASEDESENEED